MQIILKWNVPTYLELFYGSFPEQTIQWHHQICIFHRKLINPLRAVSQALLSTKLNHYKQTLYF